MKQVLLHSNDSYLFPLPQTYLSLVKEISNKTNLFENNINIYHKGKFVTENNFQNINENLNILDIRPKLKGGGGFPDFTTMVFSTVFQTILTSTIGTIIIIIIILTATYSLEKPELRTAGILETIGTIQFVPTTKTFDWKREVLFLGIFYYIFAVVPAFSILALKSKKCPTFKPPWNKLGLFAAIPFPVLLVVCWAQMSTKPGTSSDPSILYIILGIVLCLCGYNIMNVSNETLKEWEHEDANTDLYNIPIYAIFWYCALRFLLIWGNNTYGFAKGTFMMIATVLFVTISVTPDYIDAYLRYISSPFSKCPQ